MYQTEISFFNTERNASNSRLISPRSDVLEQVISNQYRELLSAYASCAAKVDLINVLHLKYENEIETLNFEIHFLVAILLSAVNNLKGTDVSGKLPTFNLDF